MNNYKYTISIKNENIKFICYANQYILDAALNQNILVLPYSCKTGACSTCISKVIKGDIIHDNQIYLDTKDLQYKYFLTCNAKPKTDVIININQEIPYLLYKNNK